MTAKPPPPPPPAPLAGTQPLNKATRRRMVHGARTQLLRASHRKMSLALAIGAGGAAAGLAWSLNVGAAGIGAWALTGTLGFAAFVWWILAPMVVHTGMAVMARAGWLVGYFDDTATQLVHPRHGCWELSDHQAVQQGKGIAAPFRRRVFAHLAAEADHLEVAITMGTRVDKLVSIYQADMPGLYLVSTKRTLFGTLYRLRRDPDPLPRVRHGTSIR